MRLSQGDGKAAIEVWEKLLRVAPERAYLAFPRLEAAYVQLGTPSRFLDLCRRLVEANPQDWRARLALGQHVADNGEPARALDLLFEALVHNPHALAVHQAIWRTLSLLEFNETLVRRYVGLTREAVFYLDPHVCMLPLPQHRALVAVPTVPRVEHLRRGADRSGRGQRGNTRVSRGQVRRCYGWR